MQACICRLLTQAGVTKFRWLKYPWLPKILYHYITSTRKSPTKPRNVPLNQVVPTWPTGTSTSCLHQPLVAVV